MEYFDKTLRSIFSKDRPGINEWNDRRDYRTKYEKTKSILERDRSPARIVVMGLLKDNPFLNMGPLVYNEMQEDIIPDGIERVFPFSEITKKRFYEATYGYSEEGNCDRCGSIINILNSGMYSCCNECETQIEYSHNPLSFLNTELDEWIE